MKNRWRALALAGIAACGRGAGGSPPPAANACDALAIAAAASHQLRDAASAQYASADHAMVKWAQLEKNAAPADDTGEYSGAGARAQSYGAAGFALCQGAKLVHDQMFELTRSLPSGDVTTAAAHLSDFGCDVRGPIEPDPANRRTFADGWASKARSATNVEDAVINTCVRVVGGTRKTVQLPALVLPTE